MFDSFVRNSDGCKRVSVTKQLMDPIDVHSIFFSSSYYESQWGPNCLVTHILQNIFFSVQVEAILLYSFKYGYFLYIASLQKAFINPRSRVEFVYDGWMHFYGLENKHSIGDYHTSGFHGQDLSTLCMSTSNAVQQ